jgi:hypothetical protein
MTTNIGKDETVGGNLSVNGSLNSEGAISTQDTVTAVGNMYAPDFVPTSDYRLKENVRNININEALGYILKLVPVEFNWKNSKEKNFGFLAHEVQKVISILVEGKKDDPDHFQHLRYIGMIPLLVGAIIAQQQQINDLKEQLNRSYEEG